MNLYFFVCLRVLNNSWYMFNLFWSSWPLYWAKSCTWKLIMPYPNRSICSSSYFSIISELFILHDGPRTSPLLFSHKKLFSNKRMEEVFTPSYFRYQSTEVWYPSYYRISKVNRFYRPPGGVNDFETKPTLRSDYIPFVIISNCLEYDRLFILY